MNSYECFAVNQFLSAYPDDASFYEILTMLEEDNDDVLVWEPFEYTNREQIAGMIADLAFELQEAFIAREELQEHIKHSLLNHNTNVKYSDVISDGGMDPRYRNV